MEDKAKRGYVSHLRREHAEATRLRIAEAARELLLERGYAETTMGDVAKAAGVAVQTLYAACPGGKPALAKIVHDVTLAGDAQPIPQEARPEVQAIIAEPDPMRKLARYAAMALAISRRVGPVYRVLRAAAATTPTDHGLHELLSSTEQQRRTGSRGPAEHLAAIGVLRTGLTVDRAADQIYVLTSIEIFERLTDVCGWSDDDYQEWLTRTLADALLDRSTRAATS